MDLRQQSKHELVAAIRGRYWRASRREKGRILDEFVASTGYHRKWAIRLLRDGPPKSRKGRGGRPRVYSAREVGALRRVAEGCVPSSGVNSHRRSLKSIFRRSPVRW